MFVDSDGNVKWGDGSSYDPAIMLQEVTEPIQDNKPTPLQVAFVTWPVTLSDGSRTNRIDDLSATYETQCLCQGLFGIHSDPSSELH